jgi:predicted RNA-binding Zn-ribbon protein involved in translation (DUF1610 family)
MKLRDARICVGCDEVFEPKQKTDINDKTTGLDFSCPSCGCSATFLICQWLPTMNVDGRKTG